MIKQAIDRAMKVIGSKLSEAFIEVDWVRNTEAYDTATGKNVITSSTQLISGSMDTFSYSEVDNVKVLQDDVKLLVLSTAEIDFNSLTDQIKIGLLTYNIVTIRKIAVGTKNILYTLQLRM